MAQIRFKKPSYPVSNALHGYLCLTNRETEVSISYRDLLRYNSSVPLYDNKGADTMWETLIYSQSDQKFIFECLRIVYAQLKVGGDVSIIDHLYIDRVDYCLYANTHPIRVRIVNQLNDLFDYFYIKEADMSRIYGLELEHLLSPHKINYIVKGNTLIEEHIQGIPGDSFINNFLSRQDFNPLRVAKEFVKFNERCLVLLLGDMRNDNFVVEVIPDFDELHFRLRPVDFDQYGYEGEVKIYMPQYFKENNPLINLGFKSMSPVLELQYQKEERTRMLSRARAAGNQLEALLEVMREEELSTNNNVLKLKAELAHLYQDGEYEKATTIGDLVAINLNMLEKYPTRKRLGIRMKV